MNIENKSDDNLAGPRHEKLWVWRLAHELRLRVYEICRTLPAHEKFRGRDQIERSSNSVPDNLAEGNSAYYFNDKIKCFYISRKEAGETQNHLRAFEGKGYISAQESASLISKYEEVIRGTNGLINRTARKREEYKFKGDKRL